MKHKALTAGLALLGSVLTVPVAQAAIGSTFDVDADGWQAVDLDYLAGDFLAVGSTFALTHEDGGNPGGRISASDPSSQSFYFQAPAKFLGNLGAYYGGALTFDQIVTPATPAWRDAPDVVLGSGDVQLLYRGANNPTSAWTSFLVPLTESGWHVGTLTGAAPTAAQFTAMLGAVSVFRIRGEYVDGVFETTSLDNVLLTPVPEPETWALMAAGLAGLALRARRRAV